MEKGSINTELTAVTVGPVLFDEIQPVPEVIWAHLYGSVLPVKKQVEEKGYAFLDFDLLLRFGGMLCAAYV